MRVSQLVWVHAMCVRAECRGDHRKASTCAHKRGDHRLCVMRDDCLCVW